MLRQTGFFLSQVENRRFNMRASTFLISSLLAIGSVGMAHANLIINGDFSQASPVQNEPTQFTGAVNTHGFDGTASDCTYGGNFINGWESSNGGYGIWYPSAAAASGVTSCNQYNGATTQRLPSAVSAPPTGLGTFVGLDGQSGIAAGIQQTINGLTAGAKYTVSFYWANTQEMSRTGPTSEQFDVSLGSEHHSTAISSIGTQGWSGWMQKSLTFTAGSATEILNFLSVGSPSGAPPFALLSGVSMTQNVPEPPVLAMFGIGLFGLGLVTVSARRREMRRRDTSGHSGIS
ncbi:MAG: PEP-CTERM sorting domain-containing protein [Rhodanobacter sp.]